MIDIQNPYFDDHELIKMLWLGDDTAWEYVFLRTVIPVTRQNKYYNILADRKLTQVDVLGMVYEIMIAKQKLSNFQFRCPLIFWMRNYVVKVILQYCEKNPWAVSDEEFQRVNIGKVSPDVPTDELEVAQKCFAKLWELNPTRAYVHMLRVKNKLSAVEIMNLLGLSSEDNVNKIFSRAISDMKKFREQSF